MALTNRTPGLQQYVIYLNRIGHILNIYYNIFNKYYYYNVVCYYFFYFEQLYKCF